MAARRSDLHRPLDVLLAHNVGEVGGVGDVAVERCGEVNRQRLNRPQSGQVADQVGQIADRDDVDIGHERRFRGVDFGDKDPLQTAFAGQRRQRQDAFRVAGGAVQRQLAHEERPFQPVGPDLVGGRQHADGNGQVIRRAFLTQIGRGEVDGDALVAGELQPAVLNGGVDPVAALADGRIRQPDEREVRLAADDIDFDLDRFRLQADDGAAENLGKHNDPLSLCRTLLTVRLVLDPEGMPTVLAFQNASIEQSDLPND